MSNEPHHPRYAQSHEHPSDDVLELYNLNRLSDSDLDDVEDHVFRCALCQERLSQEAEYIDAVKQSLIVLNQHDKPPARSWLKPILSIAASLVVGAFGINWWTHHPAPAAPAVVVLAPLRSDAPPSVVPAHQPMTIRIQRDGITADGPFQLDIVSTAGRTIWSGPGTPSRDLLEADVRPGLDPGRYWVRLHATGELVAEMTLAVQ